MEYKYAEGTDAIGGENILEGKENPYGYLSSSGWNSTLISQNYYGIYDNGVPYDDLYDTLDEEERALINYEIRTKIALPHTEYKPDDDQRLDISDGFTSFGNKILNGLFSGTTIIRVAETAAGSLTISKTVEDTAGADDHGAFPFTVGFEFTAPDLNYTDDRPEKMVGDIDLTPELAGTYDYTVSKTGEDDVTGALNIVKDDTGSGYHIDVANEEGRLNESGKLMLSDGESLTIHGLPIGTTYTVTEDDVDGYAQSVTAKSDGTVLAPDGLKVSNKIEAAGQADALSYTNTAEHTKTLSYTVEYYKDNVLVEGDTQTVKKVVNEDSPEDTLDVDKTAINVTDKYEGYKFEKTDPETLPDTVNNGDVIKVYYVTKPTKTLSYTVEYYKDGTLVAADTQTVTETVDEDAADTLTVDKASINTANKYSGYNFQKTDPAAIPDSINDGGIIKVYYVRDNSGGDDDDDDERDDKTPSKLNTDDHFAYVIGYPDGSVRPEGNITRAEAATIFFRLLKSDVRNDNLTKNSPFDDVTRDMWCNQPIATMAHLGIVQGRSADNFVPSASITRAELAAICARFDESDTKSVSEFSDVSGHWAEEEIGRAAALGWVEGYPDGTFRPDEPITRAEAMTMINRVLKRVPKGESDLRAGMNTWPDNQPGDWYYLAVQEATNSHDFNRVGRVNERWTRLRGDPDWASYER